MSRGELTDAQWERLAGLLPPQQPARGRPNKDHREVLNGILWVLRTGAPWRDVPREQFGSWKTLSSRFYRWQEAGIWARVLRQLQAEAHEDGHLDWALHFMDASVIRAHQHAAGARGTPSKGGKLKRLAAARGGFSTKLHVRAEGEGRPLVFALTAGQRHETQAFEALMTGGSVPRAHSPGAPRRLPDALVGDKGYSYNTLRVWCREHGVQAIIPTRSNQPRQRTFRRAAYRKRCRVECLFNRLKQNRRVATRYEKRAANYLAMVHIASIRLWL